MDWLSAATQGAGAIGSWLTQGTQHRHEKALNERTIQAQKEQAQFAYDKDLEMWNRANEYNAPTAQMARLREAGLNPNLVYGKGATATSSAQLPKYNATRPEYNYSPPLNPAAMLDAYNNFRLTNAQIDIAKAQARKTNAEADNADNYYYNRAELMAGQSKWIPKKLREQIEGMQLGRDKTLMDLGVKYGLDVQGLNKLWSTTGNAFSAQQLAATPEGRRHRAVTGNLLSQILTRKEQRDNIQSTIRNRELKTDYYLVDLFSRIGLNSADMLLKMLPTNMLKGIGRRGAQMRGVKSMSNKDYLKTNKKFKTKQNWNTKYDSWRYRPSMF